MENKEIIVRLKKLQAILEDYLDNVDMSEADDDDCKDTRKSDKKDKEKED